MGPDYQQGVEEAGAGIEMVWGGNFGISQELMEKFISFLHRWNIICYAFASFGAHWADIENVENFH